MNKIKKTYTTNRRGDLQNLMNVTLMMVILAFFIVLNSLAVPSDTKKKAALGSLIGTFGLLSGGMSPTTDEPERGVAAREAFIKYQKTAASRLVDKFERFLLLQRVGENVKTFSSGGGVAFSINTDILFEKDSAIFTERGEKIVEKLHEFVSGIKGKFMVEGYSGKIKTDLHLPIARAGAVARKIISYGGIKRNRVGVAGYGAMRKTDEEIRGITTIEGDFIRILYKYVA